MKLKIIIVLLVTLLWALGSWKWYTCDIKGICGEKTLENIEYNADSDDVEPLKVEDKSDREKLAELEELESLVEVWGTESTDDTKNTDNPVEAAAQVAEQQIPEQMDNTVAHIVAETTSTEEAFDVETENAEQIVTPEADTNALVESVDIDEIVEPIPEQKQVEVVVEEGQLARVHFPFNNTKSPILSDEAEIYFSDLAQKLSSGSKVTLIGHTDNVGKAPVNEIVGLARADVIRQLLVERGANLNSITIESRGESEPLQSNATDAGREVNRRVELVVE